MYAFIVFGIVKSALHDKEILYTFVNKYRIIACWAVWVVIFTCFMEWILYDSFSFGAIIQPIFIFGTVFLSFSLAAKYSETGCKKLLFIINIVIIFAAIVGIRELITQKNIFFPNYGNPWQQYRVCSLFRHPIIYAALLMVSFFYVLYFGKKKWLKAVGLIIILIGIYASRSRSCWIALVFSFFIIGLATFSHRMKKATIVRIGLILGACLAFVASPMGNKMIDSIISRFTNMSDTVEATQRMGTISYFYDLLIKEGNIVTLLLGHGEDAAAMILKQTTISIENFTTTDNQYVSFLYNYGLIVLVMVIVFLFKMCMRFIQHYNSMNSMERFCLITIISQSIGAFFYEITEAKTISFVLFVLVGFELFYLSNSKPDPC